MSSTLHNFTYPITCCDVGNAFTTNWNDIQFSQLQSIAYCAINGTNIYQTVSLFMIVLWKIKICCCFF